MEENEASKGGVFRDGVRAPMEQLHRHDPNSAVPEDGDYEDLYNDLKVGENFLESFRQNEEEEKVGGASVQAAGGEVKVEKGKNVMSIKWSGDRFRDLAVRGNEMGNRDLEKNASKNVVNREIIQRPTAASAGVSGNAGNVGNSGNDNMIRQVMVSGNAMGSIGSLGALGAGPSGGGGGGGTILFAGDLRWWTTDAQVEAESSKYGAVKEVTFFSEQYNGKSKGYCMVEFYEPAAAAACKEGMNGHVFNERACVVSFASSTYAVKRLGEALVNQNKWNAQRQTPPVNAPARWGPGDTAGKPGGNNNNATVGYSQGGGDSNRGLRRGNMGRADSQEMRNRGPVGPMRNRTGGVVGRGFLGNAGGGFGQVISAASPLIRPQTMMDQAFDPAFGGPMRRMGGHGGFPGGPTPPFSSILSSFRPAGEIDLPGVGPLVNPTCFGRGMPVSAMGIMARAGLEGPNMGVRSDPNMGRWAGDEHGYRVGESTYGAEPTYFGRGMPASAMGIMARAGLEGPNMGMWSDPNMGGRAGDEHGYRAGESNYGAEPVSDHQYGEERLSNKEKDTGSERHRSRSSDKRYINREPSPGRDIGRERERDRPHSRDHDHDLERHRDSEHKHGRPRDHRDRYANRRRYRGRSSRTQAKSRLSHEDKSRSRSKDADNEKTSDY